MELPRPYTIQGARLKSAEAGFFQSGTALSMGLTTLERSRTLARMCLRAPSSFDFNLLFIEKGGL
jgi:hypothetical protein